MCVKYKSVQYKGCTREVLTLEGASKSVKYAGYTREALTLEDACKSISMKVKHEEV